MANPKKYIRNKEKRINDFNSSICEGCHKDFAVACLNKKLLCKSCWDDAKAKGVDDGK
jgi:hypothetical protein